MGLDITAYKNVKLVGTAKDTDEWESKFDWSKTDYIWPNQDFADRLPPIQLGGVYEAEDSMGFSAGSYSGYNRWRNELAQMALGVEDKVVWANPSRYKPFVELINFSDCEGILGTDVCKKLLQDFIDYQDIANQQEDFRFIEKYNDWRKAFEYAANNGYVDFH